MILWLAPAAGMTMKSSVSEERRTWVPHTAMSALPILRTLVMSKRNAFLLITPPAKVYLWPLLRPSPPPEM